MNENTALRMLSTVMRWDLPKSQEEHQWLRLVSAVKYDGYRDFLAGVRFLESLVGWLLQFKEEHREAAYNFVRHRLVFISAAERERLVDLMYPQTVLPRLLKTVATMRGIAPWQVYLDAAAKRALEVARHRTLFLGLSDGARLDSFRHVNVGRISNEQVVIGTQLDAEKWDDMRTELQESLTALRATQDPSFETIYLVDDFAGSGTSFIRREEKDGKQVWKGKLLRFLRSLKRANTEFGCQFQASSWTLVIHHLIMTEKAVEHLRQVVKEVRDELKDDYPWFADFDVTYTYLLPPDCPLSEETDAPFHALTQGYYDKRIETKATRKGGVDHLGMGYAGCALPLVLDHNTPNNSVALLWAESQDAGGAHEMLPLFRRRQRHTK
ncbi:MAG: hypothetical protein JSR63_12755 [Proteobacteria bacterium]|nr:hypothetical protein [Pseudomonadota bacterium]